LPTFHIPHLAQPGGFDAVPQQRVDYPSRIARTDSNWMTRDAEVDGPFGRFGAKSRDGSPDPGSLPVSRRFIP